MARNNMLKEEVKQPSHLRFLETLDLGDEFAVEEETLLTRHWMYTHQRVYGIDRIFPDQSTRQAGMSDHFRRCVDSLEIVQE